MMRRLLESLPALLPAFLAQQRWFGSKARTIVRCEAEDAADLPGPVETIVVVAGVWYADAMRERYALLLSRRPDTHGLPSLGRLSYPDRDWILETATDPDAARALLHGFVEDRPVPTHRGGVLLYADVGEGARQVLGAGAPPVNAVGSEQSNTSLRVGSTLVFKLFRRLEPGENPELELGRFFTSRTSFRAMSALEGSLTYRPPSGESATLGVLQTWINNSGDGWSYVLSALGECRRTGKRRPPLGPDMTQLGVITGDFHAALESDRSLEAFRPEPVESSDVDTWSTQLLNRVSRVCALIESQLDAWPDESRRLGASLLAKSHVARAIATAAGSASASFSKIRIHGDYHLGQTLKTASGFTIIDFEGEPATPIAVRRQKHCALRDVAGMLRSFDYAIETASEQQADTNDRPWAPPDLRDAFLAGYFQSAAEHEMVSLPASPSAIAQWLTFFELEKAFYELEYEVNNRPTWAPIPLRGILRALDAREA
jgi:maltose alpha-D-glucosyltransferase/alpha-amylase